MSGSVFVDTNVLVYSRDASEGSKQARAESWIARLWEMRSGRLSAQVLSEYYVTVTAKLKPGMDPADARRDVQDLLAWKPVPIDAAAIECAWQVVDDFSLSWWDALIVSAAQLAGCEVLLTEDLQHGQDLAGVRVVDPFRTSPDDIL